MVAEVLSAVTIREPWPMNQRVTDWILQNPVTWRSPPVADGRAPWAIVLAGSDGVPLRPLVEYIHGDHRPSPYAAFLGSRSLLRQTLDRVAIRIDPERTVVIANAYHASHLHRDLTSHPTHTLLLQPADCGTAAEILMPAHAIARLQPDAIVAVSPSDHFVCDDPAFMSYLLALARFVERHVNRIVLVGARPDARPPSPHEWIERGPPIGRIPDGPLFQIRLLGDGPSPDGRACRAEDRLWNTGIFVAPVAALLELGRRRLPRLSDRLARIAPVIDSAVPPLALQAVGPADPPTNPSRDVFRASSPELVVSQLPGTLRWSDWATPERVIHALHEIRATPAWLDALTRGGARRGVAVRHPVGRRPRAVPGRRP
jgi:mannose-1-phosphate guanylyltransferase